MYEIVELSEYNIAAYDSYIDKDIAELIGRVYYRGLVVLNISVEPVASLVWQLRDYEKINKNTRSDIIWAKCNDRDAFAVLMEEYSRSVKEEGVFESRVLLPAKTGKELRALFESVGFEMEIAESDIMIARVSELAAMPFMQKLSKKKMPDNIVLLNTITMRTFRRGVIKCVERGNYGLCEDLIDLGISYFDNDVSSISLCEGEINGFFLFHRRPSGIMAVQLLRCLDDSFKTTIPYMMRRFVTAMEEKYGPDARVELDRHNEQSLLLSEKLLPRSLGMPIFTGNRKET